MSVNAESNKRISVQIAKNNAKTVLPFASRVIISLGEGKRIKEISKLFDTSRQRIEYYAKKALKEGLLEKQGDYAASYLLTQKGKQNFLMGDESGSGVGGSLLLRSHAACLKFRVLEFPSCDLAWKRLERDSREVPLQNWVARHLDCGGLEVKITTKNILVFVESFPIEAEDFKEKAVLSCMGDALEVAFILCRKYGFKLDLFHPEYVRVQDYALPDFFTRDGEKLRLSFQKGNIDYSKGYRELEYSDAKELSSFLAMPERLSRIERLLSEPKLCREEVLPVVKELMSSRTLTPDEVASMVVNPKDFKRNPKFVDLEPID